MAGRPNPGFPNDSTLPLLGAFLLALAFLGVVVAIGLSDGGDSQASGGAATSPDSLAATTPEEEVEPVVTLTLGVAGDGKGTVRVAGESRTCKEECRFQLDRDTSATIIASPTKGSKFVSWTGSCSRTRICTVTLLDSLSATALFALDTPPPEASTEPECDDAIDNDSDTFIDGADDDCLLGDSEFPVDPVQPPPPPAVTTPQPVPVVPPPPVVVPPPVVPPPPPPPPPVAPAPPPPEIP